MRDSDTNIGGKRRGFPETDSDLLPGLRAPDAGVRRVAFEDLCQRYWKPAYLFLRTGWAKTNEDAKDLTQAFFLWLLESGAVSGYDAGRGSFRRYLKVMLRSFVSHEDRALHALKRGGGVQFLSLEGSMPQVEEVLPDSGQADPEKVFERMWLVELVKAATERVREQYRREGRDAAFEIYKEYVLDAGGERPTYAALADRLGLNVRDVEAQLRALRLSLRREIRSELSQMTPGDHELEEELVAIFGA